MRQMINDLRLTIFHSNLNLEHWIDPQFGT